VCLPQAADGPPLQGSGNTYEAAGIGLSHGLRIIGGGPKGSAEGADWATKDIVKFLIQAASTGYGHLYYT